MSYYILPKNNNTIYLNPISCETHVYEPYLSRSLYSYYSEIKEQITNTLLHCNDLSYNTFDEIIKVVNPHEYIFSKVPGSKFSVSKLRPNTNLFYDFLEVSNCINIFDKFLNQKINSLFVTNNECDVIECFEMIREGCNDDITRYSFLNEDVIKNIQDKKFDFIFFETSETSANEYICHLLQLVITILSNQNVKGDAVIKLNGIFFRPIVEIIYLLTTLFENVYIIKPNSNNVTTFDKYLVCKNFINNENSITHNKSNKLKLEFFFKTFQNNYVTSILDFELPYYFNTKLDDINITIGHQQLETLDQIISILKNKNKNEKIETIKKTNIQKSVNWCEKYKIPYNKFTEKTNIFLPIMKELELN